jgi:nicotinamidase-related amidase
VQRITGRAPCFAGSGNHAKEPVAHASDGRIGKGLLSHRRHHRTENRVLGLLRSNVFGPLVQSEDESHDANFARQISLAFFLLNFPCGGLKFAETKTIMPDKNSDLHGFAPDHCRLALLLIDVINDLEFPEGEQILPDALEMAKNIAALKKRVQELKIPVVYVNDNFGRWQSDFRGVVEHCLHDGVLGQPLAELLAPAENDYFVLKPKHSGFFSSTLDILLDYLQVKTVILTGLAGNICVLFTANDAYMRDFNLVVPSDCVASNTDAENRHALEQMARVLKADTRASTKIDLKQLLKPERDEEEKAKPETPEFAATD